MNRMIEVIYEDNVFKPLYPIEELGNHQKAWIIIFPSSYKKVVGQIR